MTQERREKDIIEFSKSQDIIYFTPPETISEESKPVKQKEKDKVKEGKICKIYIEKMEDRYHYLIEDPFHSTSSFRDTMRIPFSSRAKILEKLESFCAIGGRERGTIAKNFEDERLKETFKKIGSLIFKYMIPPSCKEYLSNIDIKYVILSTDDVEIPWELIYDGKDFYCLKYSIGRKVEARIFFKTVKRKKRKRLKALFIANPTKDLPNARKEVDAIVTTFQKELDLQYLKEEEASIEVLLDVLESEKFDIFHYAGHANFNTKHPEESIIRLHEGEITAKYLLNLFEDIPPSLVFMNACESAATKDIEYLEYKGRLTGIANAFISAGVNAYIGALWPIHDKIASELSINFYRKILRGESIGSALREKPNEMHLKNMGIFQIHGPLLFYMVILL